MAMRTASSAGTRLGKACSWANGENGVRPDGEGSFDKRTQAGAKRADSV
jgi:hypothetical protein